MNFQHDLAMISKNELEDAGITVPKEWDDYHICMKYLELEQRWFDSSIAYNVFYSKELEGKIADLSKEEQCAIKDIEYSLKNNISITPYMSKDRFKTDVAKSDFLLKNWNIYHLHLEKAVTGKKFTNSNLLFFQRAGDSVYMIDVMNHPRGNDWFDRRLLDIVFDNWPKLLKYRPGMKATIEVPDEGMHDLLKSTVSIVNFRDGCLFPTNLGVASSGDSSIAVRQTDYYFNSFVMWEKELSGKEADIRNAFEKQTGCVLKKKSLEYELIVENGYFVAYEKDEHFKIKMFKVNL